MKAQGIIFERLTNQGQLCLNCLELATQQAIYGDVSQLCCDDEDCMSHASNQVQIAYASYPMDYRTPHGSRIINPTKEQASKEA